MDFRIFEKFKDMRHAGIAVTNCLNVFQHDNDIEDVETMTGKNKRMPELNQASALKIAAPRRSLDYRPRSRKPSSFRIRVG